MSQPPLVSAPRPPKSSNTAVIVTAALVGFFVLLCGGTFAACSVMARPPADTGGGSARSDVKLSGCRAEHGGYYATLTVKNSTSATADYTVELEWRSGGARVADRTERIYDVPSGGTVVEESVSLGTERTSATCVIREVRRS